ncbi:MAG: hypothetical protein QXQ96_03230 [Sulfolobales archaeon]
MDGWRPMELLKPWGELLIEKTAMKPEPRAEFINIRGAVFRTWYIVTISIRVVRRIYL